MMLYIRWNTCPSAKVTTPLSIDDCCTRNAHAGVCSSSDWSLFHDSRNTTLASLPLSPKQLVHLRRPQCTRPEALLASVVYTLHLVVSKLYQLAVFLFFMQRSLCCQQLIFVFIVILEACSPFGFGRAGSASLFSHPFPWITAARAVVTHPSGPKVVVV